MRIDHAPGRITVTASAPLPLALLACLALPGLLPDAAGADPLHEVVASGDRAGIERLVAAGADLESFDDSGLTPLVTAALAGNTAIVSRLVELGADPHGRDAKGFTALHAAAHAGHEPVVRRLLDLGLAPDDQDNVAKITPLHASAERNFLSVAGLLLDRGAAPSLQAATGHTPTMMATLKGFPEMVRLLRRHGAQCTEVPSRLREFRDFCAQAAP